MSGVLALDSLSICLSVCLGVRADVVVTPFKGRECTRGSVSAGECPVTSTASLAQLSEVGPSRSEQAGSFLSVHCVCVRVSVCVCKF